MKRRGFTLVELLVVIAIIAMLVTLLLPAVQAARAAARRSQCQNNLKNLALGLINYDSAFGHFPPGWIAKTNNQAEWGWNVLIFPFVEEQSLYDSMQVDERRLWDVILDSKTRGLVQTPLPLFRCPEDQQNDLLPGGRNSFSAPIERHFRCANCPGSPQFEPATSNYMGVSGFFDRSGHVPNGKDNGVLHANSEVKIGQIIDGTSKTFAVGERDRRCKQGAWCGARNPPGPDMWGSYFVRGRVSMKLNDPRVVNASRTCAEGFSSSHAGGAFFAYCDGHVAFISDDIHFNNGGMTDTSVSNNNNPRFDPLLLGVYQRLGIRNDEQPIQEIY